jgi:GTP pyrophosphokinase
VVAKLVDGVLKMAAITNSRAASSDVVLGQQQAQTETVRKMLIAIVDDVRVALIKVAERTGAIRAVKNLPERRQKVAKEVFEIYAPLAHRLGIGHIKWELEDLSFRYLHSDSYKRIATLLDERRLDRQLFIDEVLGTLNSELAKADIEGEVTGRAKHIYSIWRKMQRKQIGFSQVYDIRAVRILVPEVKDCYSVLGIIHTLWRNIPKEFDDYIAVPKENGYRSLHTAVIGPQGKVLEVQIRTFGMHEEAEFGVCAHWLYKGADKSGAAERSSVSGYEEKIAWLRQVLDWHEETGGIGDLAEQLSGEVIDDRIYVFTPEGHVVELTRGATPLDFAYHIHTEVGHRCRGAKVNGRIIPLTYQLETGDQVEIITGRELSPSRDWLRPGLAYLKSSRARAKVRLWFKQQDRDQHIDAGRSLVEKEFKRMSLTSLDFKTVAGKVGFGTVDDMFAAIGAGDIGTGQVLNAAQQMVYKDRDERQIELSPQWRAPVSASRPIPDDNDVLIHGVGNLLTSMASCCQPVPGDAILGYITQGRGVSIHRQDCVNVLQLQEREPERIIEVHWGGTQESTYAVDIAIEAFDRHGLLRDVTVLLANERINVIAVNTLSDQDDNTANMKITVEVPSIEVLSHILVKISHLPNIIAVSRADK